MVLIANQPQGSYATYSVKPVQWNRGKLKTSISFKHIARADGHVSVRRNVSLSRGQINLQCKAKSFRIFSFKGPTQSPGCDGRSNSRSIQKNPAQLSYTTQEKDNSAISEDAQNAPLSHTPAESGETMKASQAIQRLFKRWLVMLQTQTPNQTETGLFEDGQNENKIIQSPPASAQGQANKFVTAAVGCFSRLDATVKYPLLTFLPLYLAVNVAYGAEVSSELTPLWVLGPLILALYIKVVQGLCALYVFSFKLSLKLIKNAPSYYFLAYNYIAEGKFSEYLRAHFWQPVVDLINLDYKEASKKKMEELKDGAKEKYLDFVESIWPYYCRTIRFLKKANLI